MNKFQKKIHKIIKNKSKVNRYVCTDSLDRISYREARIIIKSTVKHFGFFFN